MQAIPKHDIFVPSYSKTLVAQTELPKMNVLSNEVSFEEMFKTYFKPLYIYACTIVKSEILAEEIVQNVFLKLWEKKEHLWLHSAPKAYLYKAVHNDSLNALKHQKVKLAYQQQTQYRIQNTLQQQELSLETKELEEKIRVALNELPEQCRTIFQLSRYSDLKYQEIADFLGLSIKTIENQMGKALKLLRLKLAEYLPFFIYAFFNLINLSN